MSAPLVEHSLNSLLTSSQRRRHTLRPCLHRVHILPLGPLMSSFFQKLHGIPSSSVITTTKVRQAQLQPRSKTTVKTVSKATIARQSSQNVKHIDRKPNITKANHGGSPRLSETSSLRAAVLPMRRTQSSTATPVSKKRKTPPVTALKTAATRDVSLLSTSTDVKRRRTASPACRVHRSSSDDETDFSEPVKLF